MVRQLKSLCTSRQTLPLTDGSASLLDGIWDMVLADAQDSAAEVFGRCHSQGLMHLRLARNTAAEV